MIGSNLLVGIDIICNDQFVASKHCSFLSDSTLETLPVPRLAQQQAQAAHDITTPHYYEHHSRKANQSIAILASSYYSEIGHFQDFIRMVWKGDLHIYKPTFCMHAEAPALLHAYVQIYGK
jgi:hypothetical protein